jgi:acetyltransferase EpsM
MVRDILLRSGRRPVAFLDSDSATHGRTVDDLPVLGGVSEAAYLAERGLGVVVAIGHNRARVSIAEELERLGAGLIGAVHPLASIARSAVVAEHVIIGPRAVVCVNARIAEHSILAAGVIADHDVRIGRGCHLHPAVRLAGAVEVEDFATIGIGACVIPGRRIGRDAQVQAGAVVIRDVRPSEHAAGVPARAVPAPYSGFTPESLPVRAPGGAAPTSAPISLP